MAIWVSCLVYKKWGNSNLYIAFIYDHLKKTFFFGIYLVLLMEGYFFLCLYSFYEVFFALKTGSFNVLSLGFTVIILFVLLALPIFLIVHYTIYKHDPEIIHDSYFAQLYNGLHIEKRRINGYYYAF